LILAHKKSFQYKNQIKLKEDIAKMIAATMPDESRPSTRKAWRLSIAFALVAVLAISLGLGFGLRRDESLSTNSLRQIDNAKSVSKSTNGSGTGSDTQANPVSAPTPYPTLDPTSNLIGSEDPITFTSRLTTVSNVTIKQAYGSCNSLSADLYILAQKIVNRTIESNSYYFDDSGYYYTDDDGIAVAAATTNTGNKTKILGSTRAGLNVKSVTESSFSTNNQIEGVQEGDLVQSNGEQVFVVYGREIIELAADTVTITKRTKLPGKSNTECSTQFVASTLLIDDKLIVVDTSTSYCNQDVTDSTGSSETYSYYPQQDTNNVYIYDVSNMSLVKTVNLNGTFVTARAIEDNVHIVTSKYIDTYILTQDLDPWRDDIYGFNVTEPQYRAKAQEIASKRVQEFVDSITQGLDCTSFQQIVLFQNIDAELEFASMLDSIVAVTSIDTKSDSIATSVSNVMLPGSGYTVFASAEYLILAVQGWLYSEIAAEVTYLISYKLDGQSANATSLGTVPGYVLNQFSIDHAVYDGENYLRVASTTSSQWGEASNGDWIQMANTTSQVTVLKLDDDVSTMTVVGTVGNLGKDDETIYSVRFVGDRGYVTTFEVIDPFYTLDLSDPSNPTKVGELVVPGYSTYLHPVGNDLIIAVGQATDSVGAPIGVQVSLFDVSSFSNPIRIQNFTDTGNANISFVSYSEVEYDFKAFRYLNDSQLLVIPITFYNSFPCPTDDFATPTDDLVPNPDIGSCTEATDGYDGFRVYEVSTDGISLYMSIRHDVSNWTSTCWSDALLPARSLLFDGDLMTMKSHSILSHDLSTMEEDATPINLDNETTVCESYYSF
jgi:uncharacterized secreted protein with C-terminal beta-propeller domain